MTNEWKEFQSYVTKPSYFCINKKDLSFLGRFSFKTLTEYEGLGRILTVIARGYLFHNTDGSLKDGKPYDRIEYARNALCAWCSVPEEKDGSDVNFKHLHKDFPELVSEDGKGWFYSHIKNIHFFAMCNASVISTDNLEKISLIAKNFETPWKNKVKQMQIPAFSINTKGTWVLKFDYIIADALELGPLRPEAATLPIEFHSKVIMCEDKGLPFEAVRDVVCYCLANKTEDSEWVVLPVANFDCYYNSTIFSKKWLSRIPETIIKRESALGICRVKLMLE